jgi:hypothetical protein
VVLTVLTTLPDLLMIVIASTIGILAVEVDYCLRNEGQLRSGGIRKRSFVNCGVAVLDDSKLYIVSRFEDISYCRTSTTPICIDKEDNYRPVVYWVPTRLAL